MAPRILSIPGITLICIFEALFISKAIPNHVSGHDPFIKLFFTLLPLHFLGFAIFWGVIYPFLLSPIRHFPAPKAGLATVVNIEALQRIIDFFQGWSTAIAYSRYMGKKPPGSPFLAWAIETPNDGILLLRSFFHRNRLLVTKPNALADILVANAYDFQKPLRIRNFLRHVLGDGLIIVEGEPHKFQRKHLMPAFSFRHIKDLYPMMWKKAQALMDRLSLEIQEHPSIGDINTSTISGTTEINNWASKVTLDIIGVSGLGREINALKNSDDQLVKDYEELLEPTSEKLLFFFMKAFVNARFTEMLPWKMNQTFARLTGSLRSICQQMVQDKRESMKRGEQHFDILSLLIKSNDFSDDELVDQLLTFLAAGHETTSSAFTWATFLLATHKDVQARLREEVRNALPKDPISDPSFDLSGVLEKLPLLNAVCNETLRLYPTVPITIRIAVRDTRLAGYPIPRGTEVVICPWEMNRHPDFWGPDADQFKPERWIDDGKSNNSGGAENNYCLMTFLHGPRSCIGQNFAKAEVRCLLASFVTAFEWEMDMNVEDVLPAGVITIKPRDGLRIKLTKIT